MVQYNSNYYRLLLAAISCAALTGCVMAKYTAGYSVGSINSISQGQFRKNAVLEFDLVIDSIKYVVRAPAECKSLVNAFSGIRVTEQNGRAYEFKLKTGQSGILSTNYSCDEADATVILNYSQLLSVYRVERFQNLVVRQDWVVPIGDAESATASIVLAQMAIDHIRTDSNATVIENLPDALKRLAQIPKNQALVTMFSPRMALDSTIVGSDDSQVLGRLTEPQPLPQGMPKRIVDRLEKAGYSGLKMSSTELATKITEVPFEYIESQNMFRPDLKNSGRRMFYPVPIEVCKTPANCANQHTNVQIESLSMPTSKYSFIYSPAAKLVFIRQSEQF